MFMTELELQHELDINFVNKFSVSRNLFLNMNILVRTVTLYFEHSMFRHVRRFLHSIETEFTLFLVFI